MSHYSYSVNGEGTSHKDHLSRILDELSSLKLWKEKHERKEKGKKRVEEISQDERLYCTCDFPCVCSIIYVFM